MSKVEVLVACVGEKDDRLYKEMNLQTDAIFANQCDVHSYNEYIEPNGCTAKLVSTADKGVGKNRNKAFMYATGEYLLCADQDMVYKDEYEKLILDAFSEKPDADIVAFNLVYRNRFTQGKKPTRKFSRIHLWNSMRYGTARIAIRRASVEKHALSFSVLYGGGAKYSSGEDSLFIREALSKGLRMYSHPAVIAEVKQETSSWFTGYNDKFFIDKGVLIANLFPIFKGILAYYFAYQLRNCSPEYNFLKIRRLMRIGIKEYRDM